MAALYFLLVSVHFELHLWDILKKEKKKKEAILEIEFCGVCNSGMMGSGKTTVGRILSEALGYCFVDRLVILLSLYVFI